MFRRHFYWAIHINSNFTTSEDLITDLDSGHVLRLFFNMNVSIFSFDNFFLFIVNLYWKYSLPFTGNFSYNKFWTHNFRKIVHFSMLGYISYRNVFNLPKYFLTVHFRQTEFTWNALMMKLNISYPLIRVGYCFTPAHVPPQWRFWRGINSDGLLCFSFLMVLWRI